MSRGNYGSFSSVEILKVIWDRPSEVRSDTILQKDTELRAITEITADVFPFALQLCTHDNFVSERHMLNLLEWLRQDSGMPDFDKIYSLRRFRIEDFKKHLSRQVSLNDASGEMDMADIAQVMLRVTYNKFWHQTKDRFSHSTSYLSLEIKQPIFKVLYALNVMSEGEWDIAAVLNSVYAYLYQTGQLNPGKYQLSLF